MRPPCQRAPWLLAGCCLVLFRSTGAFLPALPGRPLPTTTTSSQQHRPSPPCRGRAVAMINLPRFNFGAKGDVAIKEVDVNQIRGGSAVATPPPPKVAVPPTPEIKAPSITNKPPSSVENLEDKGPSAAVGSRFRNAEAAAAPPKPAPIDPVSTDVVLNTITEDSTNIQSASAVIGGLVGFAVGGPVMALCGAALLSFSCTASNEAGDAARGTGKTTLEAYNFVAKVDKKRRFLKRLADWAINLYNRIKSEATDRTAIDDAEKTLKQGLEVTADLYVKYDVPTKLGKALEKTGELTVSAIRTVIRYNKEYKITERLVNIIKEAAASSSSSKASPSST